VVSLNFKLSIVLTIGLFAYYAYTSRPAPMIDLSQVEYRIGDGVPGGWNKICLLGQQEIPGAFVAGASENPCDLKMGSELEVRTGRVLMVYLYETRQCEAKWFSGYFLAKNISETRCFLPKDTRTLSLHFENEIINLRSK